MMKAGVISSSDMPTALLANCTAEETWSFFARLGRCCSNKCIILKDHRGVQLVKVSKVDSVRREARLEEGVNDNEVERTYVFLDNHSPRSSSLIEAKDLGSLNARSRLKQSHPLRRLGGQDLSADGLPSRSYYRPDRACLPDTRHIDT